jgi:hypothetical protein
MSKKRKTADPAQEIMARINAIKKELIIGNEAYRQQYAIAYEKWEAIPNHKKAFNPEKCFILVAIKERLYNLLRELAKLEEILPEG